MPGYPDHDGARKPERRKTDFWGMLCNPRGIGAGVARGAMIVCAVILPIAGGISTVIGNAAWEEYKRTRATIDDTSSKLDRFLTASEVRREDWGRRLVNIENANSAQQAQIDAQANRLTRLEAERRR